MMRVLITRPEADAEVLAEVLAGLGIDSIAAPLLDINYTPGPELDLAGVQAVLFTSANGVRAFCRRSPVRELAALAVGDATAGEARAHGFENVSSATGDVDQLALLAQHTYTPDGGELFHAAGSRVAGNLKGMLERAGFTVRREVLYTANAAQRLPDAAAEALKAGDVDAVLFYSPRTAEQFAHLATAAGLAGRLARVRAVCLSAAVAEKLGHLGWAAVEVAAAPNQEALLGRLKAG